MAQTIAITTAQNVTLEYELANLGDRILAFILDNLIKGGYILLVLLTVLPQVDGFSMVTSAILFVLFLPVIFYTLLFEAFNDGQTPGKRAMNVRVVHLEGEEVSFSSYFLRWLFRILDISILSGMVAVISIALSERGQRIGDTVANTTVISLKKKGSVKQSAYEQISSQYEPSYAAAASLSSSDISTIKEVLSLKGPDAYTLKTQLAEKLEKVLGVKKQESSDLFLRRIVQDYNYYEQAEQ